MMNANAPGADDVSAPEPAAFDLKSFCARYQIGRTSAYEEIGNGRLTAIKFGRKTLIARVEATRWFNALPRLKPRG